MATQTVAHGDDEQVEEMIVRKGKTAPRVTPADIESAIASEHYFTAENGVRRAHEISGSGSTLPPPIALSLLTFCVLVLRNGFSVTGEAACVSQENFDPEIGRKVARQNAIQKIWPLEGYLLRQRLYEAGKRAELNA